MANKPTILKRLDGLVPDVDTIAAAYGVDQKRAKAIQKGMSVILSLFGELIIQQAELIEGQAETAKMIDKQVGRERDAKTILGNIAVFLQADEASVQYILDQVFVPVFAAAFGRLPVKRQKQLFTSLREAINDLQKMDGMLV